MANIDLFTIYSGAEAEYAVLMRRSLELFKSGKHKVNYYCVHSGDVVCSPDGFKHVGSVSKWDKNPTHGSMNHALGLNIVPKFVSSNYVLIVDCDIVVTYRGWDVVLLDKLKEFDCFGFDFGRDGPRYRGFPGVFFFGFRSDILNKVTLDWRPRTKPDGTSLYKYNVSDSVEARYMGVKIGSCIKCDTGWRIPIIVRDAGFSGGCLNRVLGGERDSLLPFSGVKQRNFCLQKPEHMAEWHFGGKLFGSHKQASRSHHLYDSEWGRVWHERVNSYVMSTYGVNI